MTMHSRSGPAGLALLLAFTLAACDREASGSSNPDGPKWRLNYSGDLSGHIEGKSVVIVRTGPSEHLNFAVRTIGNNPGLTATLSVHEGKPSGFLTWVTLEDGTRCAPFKRSDVSILDTSKETFHATVNGQMKCGQAEDQIIDFQAVIQER
ncbi:hypothetical protein [Thioalkalivibrio sp. XN8]|uniref:hypothetical protein n=1 Tax=Thioalkalivibrio sp. XN8 TaxID=2712863 RepID=UPI0013E9B086|nr:hypothetical protein [Thioalkalivibrio sp. XN8]NGP54447.1 hypothetical protein [Thioalkalivibrio sp. XN8]